MTRYTIYSIFTLLCILSVSAFAADDQPALKRYPELFGWSGSTAPDLTSAGTVTGTNAAFTDLASCTVAADAAGNLYCSAAAGSGTVTSISQGTNMSFSVNPITTTGTINLTASPSVTNLTASGTVTGAVVSTTGALQVGSDYLTDITGAGLQLNAQTLRVGGTVVTDVDFNDGAGNSPVTTWTTGSGTVFGAYAEDTDDDLQIQANTANREAVDFVNIGAGVMDVTADGTVTGVVVSATGALQVASDYVADLTGTGLTITAGALTPACVTITGSAALCDGNDADSGGATAWNAIGDAAAAGSIDFAGNDQDIISAEDGGDILTLTNTDADHAGDSIILRLASNDATGDANLIFLRATADEDGTPTTEFNLASTATSGAVTMTLGSTGVVVSTDGDGAMEFLGQSTGSDECLALNLDDTANKAVFGQCASSSALTHIQFSSVGAQIGDGTNDVLISNAGVMTFTGTAQPYVTILLSTASAVPVSASAPQYSVLDGTNTDKYVLLYDGTTAESAQWNFIVPANIVGTTCDAYAYWSMATCTGASADTVHWDVSSNGVTDDEASDATFGSAAGTDDTCGTANRLYISPAMTFTHGWAGNDEATVKVARDPSDAQDNGGECRLHYVRIQCDISQLSYQ